MGEKIRKHMISVMESVEEITASELQDKITAGDDLHIIDVRDESEWQAGHLSGAHHMSRGKLEFIIENIFPDGATPLVLYCGGGSRSALAAQSLQTLGYQNVLSLKGGFRGWNADGGEVVVD